MQEILVISFADFFDAASWCHSDVILLPAICRVTTVCSSRILHTAHMQQLNCYDKKRLTFLCPTCGLQTTQISVLRITRYGGIIWAVMQRCVSIRDKSIVWMNWNGGSLMSDAVLNSRFLTRLLTSAMEDIEHVCAKGGHFEYSLWTDNVDFVGYAWS